MSGSSYKNLIVWQKSFALVKQVYALTDTLPSSERFGIISQIQRSAVSIPSNIAEGHQRGGDRELAQFLRIARGSAAELETQLLLVNEIYSVNAKNEIMLLNEVQKMLNVLIQRTTSR